MRIPYGIYNMAKAYALQQRFDKADNDYSSFVDFMQSRGSDITRLRSEARQKRMERILGRGKYSVGRFNRDFKSLVPRSIRANLEEQINSAISGRGAYSGRGLYTNSNNLVEGGRVSMDIDGGNDETQSICVSHTEYLQDVFGAPSASFSVEAWNLNPGLIENFPWLSQIAANYEEYEFIQLLFHFKSTVDVNATNNNNGATGTIIMATNYNPSAPNFANKESMMQYHGANSGRVVEDHTHGVECDPEKNAGTGQKFIRSQPVVNGQDVKTFDLGKFQLAQVNIPSAFFNQQIGELWVTYTVKMTKPRLYSALGGLVQESRWLNIGDSSTWRTFFGIPSGSPNTTDVNNIQWYDPTNIATMQQNMINCRVQEAYQNGAVDANWIHWLRLTLPDFITGVFEVQLYVERGGGGTFPANATATYTGSVVQFNDIAAINPPGDNFGGQTLIQTSTQSIFLCRFGVNPIVQGVDNTVVIQFNYNNNAVSPTDSPTQVQLIIRQVNPYLGASQSNPVPLYTNSFGIVIQV